MFALNLIGRAHFRDICRCVVILIQWSSDWLGFGLDVCLPSPGVIQMSLRGCCFSSILSKLDVTRKPHCIPKRAVYVSLSVIQWYPSFLGFIAKESLEKEGRTERTEFDQNKLDSRSIRSLDFSCQALAESLKKNSTLINLILLGNNIGPEGAKAWCLARMVWRKGAAGFHTKPLEHEMLKEMQCGVDFGWSQMSQVQHADHNGFKELGCCQFDWPTLLCMAEPTFGLWFFTGFPLAIRLADP